MNDELYPLPNFKPLLVIIGVILLIYGLISEYSELSVVIGIIGVFIMLIGTALIMEKS